MQVFSVVPMFTTYYAEMFNSLRPFQPPFSQFFNGFYAYNTCTRYQRPKTVKILSPRPTVLTECYKILVAGVVGKVEELQYMHTYMYMYTYIQKGKMCKSFCHHHHHLRVLSTCTLIHIFSPIL